MEGLAGTEVEPGGEAAADGAPPVEAAAVEAPPVEAPAGETAAVEAAAGEAAAVEAPAGETAAVEAPGGEAPGEAPVPPAAAGEPETPAGHGTAGPGRPPEAPGSPARDGTPDTVPSDGSLAPQASPATPPAVQLRRAHRVVRVVSVDVVLPDQFPTVTVEDVEGWRERLAFRIGTAEGVALAHALAGTSAPRPLTHDLFARSLERYGVEVLAVRLTGRIGVTYLAEIELVGPAGREVLSCRPSDGICLALRQRVPAPVLCDERLFVVSGDVLPDDPADGD